MVVAPRRRPVVVVAPRRAVMVAPRRGVIVAPRRGVIVVAPRPMFMRPRVLVVGGMGAHHTVHHVHHPPPAPQVIHQQQVVYHQQPIQTQPALPITQEMPTQNQYPTTVPASHYDKVTMQNAAPFPPPVPIPVSAEFTQQPIPNGAEGGHYTNLEDENTQCQTCGLIINPKQAHLHQ
jgi:hypothetical protein